MPEISDQSQPSSRRDSPKMQAYYAALGEFIDHFSWAETTLTGLILILARVTPPSAAQAIFRDVRVAAGITMAMRLLEARGADDQTIAAYRHLVTQLGHISAARNDIIHAGISFAPDGAFEVKRLIPALANPENAARPMPTETLRDMAADLEAIILALIGLIMRVSIIPGLAQGRADSPSLPAWRYRPPLPNRGGRKPQDRTQEQPRPPGSSPQ